MEKILRLVNKARKSVTGDYWVISLDTKDRENFPEMQGYSTMLIRIADSKISFV